MRLLFHKLGVLETHDQVEFFLLHSCNLVLVKHLFLLLSCQLLFDHSASPVLFVLEIHLAFLLSLLLLVLNHVLNLLSSLCLDALVLFPLLSVHLLFRFGFVRLLLDLELGQLFVLLYLLAGLLFNLLVNVGFLLNFHQLVLLSLKLLLLQLHIATTLSHDVRCSLAGFVDLAHCLQVVNAGLLCSLQISADRCGCKVVSSLPQLVCAPF